MVAGQSAFVLIYQAASMIPISTTNILFNMCPFWINILACLLLKERLQALDIIGIMVCFAGIVMIALSKA